MHRVGLAVVLFSTGCFRNLDFAPCQENPDQALCHASDTAEIGDTAETSDATSDAVAEDTASTCTDSGPASEPCGNCGMRTRQCMPDGSYGEWSSCSGEGACVPGTSETVSTPACPGAFEERSRQCTKECNWAPTTCALRRGWSPMAAAPALFEARKSHSMVWTGTELLIWGGLAKSSAKRDGVRWSLATNTWKAMSSPPASILNRYGHAAVWTGSRMIIWSGEDYTSNALVDGAAYDPVTDSWTVIPAAPISGRSRPGRVWTGKQMIVWGGDDKMSFGAADGAAFDPAANKWSKLPDAPISGRSSPQVVFDGKDMVVWGGANSSVERTGARFDPVSLTWTMLADAPLPARGAACAAPTSGGMFVFGGIRELAADPYYETIPNGVVLDGLSWSETSIPRSQ